MWWTTFIRLRTLSNLIVSSFRSTISSLTLLHTWSKGETLDLAVSGSQLGEKTIYSQLCVAKKTSTKSLSRFVLNFWVFFLQWIGLVFINRLNIMCLKTFFCNFLAIYIFFSHYNFSFISLVRFKLTKWFWKRKIIKKMSIKCYYFSIISYLKRVWLSIQKKP